MRQGQIEMHRDIGQRQIWSDINLSFGAKNIYFIMIRSEIFVVCVGIYERLARDGREGAIWKILRAQRQFGSANVCLLVPAGAGRRRRGATRLCLSVRGIL